MLWRDGMLRTWWSHRYNSMVRVLIESMAFRPGETRSSHNTKKYFYYSFILQWQKSRNAAAVKRDCKFPLWKVESSRESVRNVYTSGRSTHFLLLSSAGETTHICRHHYVKEFGSCRDFFLYRREIISVDFVNVNGLLSIVIPAFPVHHLVLSFHNCQNLHNSSNTERIRVNPDRTTSLWCYSNNAFKPSFFGRLSW